MQSDWLRAFWPKSQEQDFSQISDLCQNKANNKHFHYRTNSVKIGTNFSKLKKKPIFCQFPHFLEQKSFSTKSGCHAQLYKGF